MLSEKFKVKNVTTMLKKKILLLNTYIHMLYVTVHVHTRIFKTLIQLITSREIWLARE